VVQFDRRCQGSQALKKRGFNFEGLTAAPISDELAKFSGGFTIGRLLMTLLGND
jgi:hypothetical protein